MLQTQVKHISNLCQTDAELCAGDRLQVTLTLMLTAVAYKLVVADNLPQVSYTLLCIERWGDTLVMLGYGPCPRERVARTT